MIKKFKVENYKAFENLEIPNLSRLNLVGGKNNVGKTSLLEALFSIHDKLSIDILLKTFMWRAATPFLNLSQDVWSPAFYNYDTSKEIKFTLFDDKGATERVSFKIDRNFIPPPQQNIRQLPNIPGQVAMNKPRFALKLEVKSNDFTSQETFIYIAENGLLNAHNVKLNVNKNLPIVQFYSTRTHNAQKDSIGYGEIVRNNIEKIVIDALHIIEPRLKSIVPIQISEKQTVLHGDIGLPSKIPLYYMGDGVTRLLSFIIAIVSSSNGIVLFDEIENGLHYSIHADMWKVFYDLAKKFNVQIISNTHSIEMVEAFNKVSQEFKTDEFSYYELFQPKINGPISASYIDSDTLLYKIMNKKSFRGE
jgi:AAA15 family ATPase/GTPase